MKKLLSYLWPQTTRIPSDYSGELEVTFYNGKKMLDSKNANYSFGTLQHILEVGLSEVDFTMVSSVLVLGLGGGSVVTSLREKFNYNKYIHAIELDKKIIDIAEKEFGIKSSDKLFIENVNALSFVYNSLGKFDVVIVDLFIDNRVPEQFYETFFCEKLCGLLSEKGNLIFNLGFIEDGAEQRNKVSNFFLSKENFQVNLLQKVAGSNYLLIVRKVNN